MEEKFLIIYDHVIQKVTRQFNRISIDLSEDIQQELRMTLLEKYRRGVFNKEINCLESFIFIMLKRRTIDLLKSSKYKSLLFLVQKDNSNTNPIDCLQQKDRYRQDQLDEVLKMTLINEFSLEDQVLIDAYYFQNKSLREIAKEMSISKDTVQRKIEKLLIKLRYKI